MPNCVVKGCNSQTARHHKKDGITFHTFPNRDQAVKEKWISVIRDSRKEPLWQPTSSSVICSTHFEISDLYITKPKGLRRVKKNAYPKILPGVSELNDEDISQPPTKVQRVQAPAVSDVPLSYVIQSSASCTILPGIAERLNNEDLSQNPNFVQGATILRNLSFSNVQHLTIPLGVSEHSNEDLRRTFTYVQTANVRELSFCQPAVSSPSALYDVIPGIQHLNNEDPSQPPTDVQAATVQIVRNLSFSGVNHLHISPSTSECLNNEELSQPSSDESDAIEEFNDYKESYSEEFVRVKQEPEWGDSENEDPKDEEEPRVRLLSEQIKVEIEFEEQRLCVKEEAVCVKEEPASPSAFSSEHYHDLDVPQATTTVKTECCGSNQSVVIKQEPLEQPELSATTCPVPAQQPQGNTGATLDQRTSDTYTRYGTYICDTCGNTYQQIHFLIQHIQRKSCSHTVDNPYACDICGNKFANKSSVKQHKLTHASSMPYSCKFCEKQFTMLTYLKAHERRHIGEKPVSCDICQKAFAKVSDVEKHRRIHTGDRPYSCEQCDKKFGHLSDLNKHKRTHTNERPYSCEVCNKTFKVSTHLNTHKRIHIGNKPYNCDECKKQFYDEVSLSMHKRVHTGEKPFSCEICKKEFTRNSSLITHRRIHTEGFPCEICHKSFRQLSNLNKHYKRHTRQKSKEKTSPDVVVKEEVA